MGYGYCGSADMVYIRSRSDLDLIGCSIIIIPGKAFIVPITLSRIGNSAISISQNENTNRSVKSYPSVSYEIHIAVCAHIHIDSVVKALQFV